MQTTVRINTDMLTVDFIEGLKKMFPGKLVEINIQPADETEYIFNNPAYTNELRDRIATYEETGKTILIDEKNLI